MSKLRQGDVLLFNTSDGGNIEIINGEPTMTDGLDNAVDMSLFESDGKPHWMDEYKTESEKTKSKFINFIEGNLKTVKNLNTAALLIDEDLAWMKDDGLVDTINIDILDVDMNRINVTIEMLKDGKTISGSEFEINWGLQKISPARSG